MPVRSVISVGVSRALTADDGGPEAGVEPPRREIFPPAASAGTRGGEAVTGKPNSLKLLESFRCGSDGSGRGFYAWFGVSFRP